MPPGLTQAQREQITAALFRRESVEDIAEKHNVSKRQIHRISKFLREYGTTVPPRNKKMGRPRTLNDDIEDDLRAYVTERPLAQLEDMATYINEKFNVKCSRASLSRWLDKLGFERRIIRRGNRSREKDVPQLSEVDMMRILADPSPDTEMMNLPGNSKKARYAWLSKNPNADPNQRKRRPKGSAKAAAETAAQPPEHNESSVSLPPPESLPGSMMTPAPATTPSNYNVFAQPGPYVSPYRMITPNGGLVVGTSPGMEGQMLSPTHLQRMDLGVHPQ